MKIEKNDMVMVYDGGGTVPHCKYTGRFGDLTAYWQEIVSDAVYLYLSGDREERKSVDCFELQDFESEEEAVAAARDFISEHKNAVNDQKHGIGSVTYWVAVVERAMEDAVMGWLPCDRDGVTEDEEGMVPDDATVAYISTLDGSREERAFELAKHDYYGFLDYKEDRYTTVYGYMD